MPAGARDVAEWLGIRYVLATFHIFGLPSRHFAPAARPGKPSPAGETDGRVLWGQDAERVNALYAGPLNRGRAAIGLPPVENVRDYVITNRPWLAADPILAPWKDLTDLDIVQTGAWILPDERPLPDELEAFLGAGEPPVPRHAPSFLPYLKGERAPVFDPDARGVLLGITARTGADEMRYAVYEGVVFSLYNIWEALGRPLDLAHGGSGDMKRMDQMEMKWTLRLSPVRRCSRPIRLSLLAQD
jgi:hypothetical protein